MYVKSFPSVSLPWKKLEVEVADDTSGNIPIEIDTPVQDDSISPDEKSESMNGNDDLTHD